MVIKKVFLLLGVASCLGFTGLWTRSPTAKPAFVLSSYTTPFNKGYEAGYKAGYCHEQGVGCLPPLAPLPPLPNFDEDSRSYKQGYNRGFADGLRAQR